MLGTAIMAIRRKSLAEKSGAFSSAQIPDSLFPTTVTARMQLTPWQRKVAHATPATPIWNAATNRISTAMLAVDEAARKKNGVLESPSAEKIPVDTL